MDPRERLENLARREATGSVLRAARFNPGFASVLALVGLALLCQATSASATPARFVVEKCDSVLPAGGIQGAQFVASPDAPYASSNSCAQPTGSLGILLTHPSTDACCARSTQAVSPAASTSASWTLPFEPTPGGRIEDITASAAFCGKSGGVFGFVLDPSWNLECGWQTRTFPSNSSETIIGAITLGCEGACDTASPAIYARNFAITEVDPQAPTLNRTGGTMLGGGILHGHQSVTAVAADEGGGLRAISVRANGAPAAPTQSFGCKTVKASDSSIAGLVATEVTPCPTQGQASWSMDTAAPPFQYGTNSLQICAADFATIGDPNQTCSTWSIKVDNTCAETSIASGNHLTAAFRRSRQAQITVGFGDSAKLQGALTDAHGRPVQGATLCIETRTLAKDRTIALVAQPTTDARGHYSYILPPGPNRQLIVAYRHDADQLERHLRYFAHARPTLHASPPQLRNGDSVHFRGLLPKPDPDGRVVVLQANVAGSERWITFHRATTNAKGKFRSQYHFSSTTHTTRYRFRALVPRQAGYPWVEGHSKPVKVLVER